MDPIRILSDEHLDTVLEMISWWRGKEGEEGTPSPGFPTAASTYVAKIPENGLPAMVVGNPDRPGHVQCELYTVVESATGTGTGTAAQGDAELELLDDAAEIYNITLSPMGPGYVLVQQIKAGEIDGYVASSGGGGAYYKHFGRAVCVDALTNESEWIYARLTHEWGEGITHFPANYDTGTGVATGTGTGSGNGLLIIVHNFLTHSPNVYEFYADIGDALLIYYDYRDPDTNIEHWRIQIPECP